jgi:dTDP-4-amino-4,6-dideoxygalactose transaminase
VSDVGTRSALPEIATRPTSYGRHLVDDDDRREVAEVLASDFLTQGPEVERFEEGLRAATGAAHGVAVANGTCALQLAYQALGVGPNRTVLTSANTFVATATAALWCGGEVEFSDVDPTNANLDLHALEHRLTSGAPPFAVVAVHFAGLPCDMARLIELKREHGFVLIEDAAHALGARYRVGERWWRVGEHPDVDATCLSFHPVKLITSAEGGAVLTPHAALAARVRSLRAHGIDREAATVPFEDSTERPPWFAPMVALGHNHRLSDVHAALGRSQLRKMGDFLGRRRAIAERYAESLEGACERPDFGGPDREHAWHLYVVHVDPAERDPMMAHLRERGIHTQVHYYPVPYQPWFRDRYGERSLPRAEAHARCAISLPIHPGLADDDVKRVVEAVRGWKRW